MQVTIFTSNQPRHTALVEQIASIADHVYVVQECNTIFPGQVKDFFNRSDIMQEYFSHVIHAENTVFGSQTFSPSNTSTIALKMGDLNLTTKKLLEPALNSDIYIIFGSSFIKGELCDFLIEKKAINVHMGLSPFYRGSSCNFWALYDKKPEYVGATIHLLSKGLDSGEILFHSLPPMIETDPFIFGMLAVKSAHDSLSQYLKKGENFDPITQNKLLEMRYTRNHDFTDNVAKSYLKSLSQQQNFQEKLERRNIKELKVYGAIKK
jgi:hypothetical protein